MTTLFHVSATGYNSRKFLVIISIVVSLLIIDISLSNISDLISVSTTWGFVAFIAIAIVYAVGQYLILDFVKQKSKSIRLKSPYFNKLSTIITIVQYVLTAIIIFIILQIFLNSYYYTFMLAWSSSISYTIASILMVILALKFFSWYRSNKNFIVLLYGVSCLVTSISIVSSLVFFTVILLDLPAQITSPSQSELTAEQKEVGHSEQNTAEQNTAEQNTAEQNTAEQKEVGHGPDIRKFDLSTTLGKVQSVFVTSHIVSFLLLWSSTAMLLHTYSKKLGKVKFWTIITIPIASFLSIFVIVTPFVQSFSNAADPTFRIVVDALGYTLPAVVSSILFGLPFLMIARSLSHSIILKDYMIIAGSGFALFALATTGNVILASYPPLGLASVSFVGLSSYLMLIGIYSSTISMSEDVNLRQVIRKSAVDESRLLVSTGSAQMEQKIEKKVIDMAKDRAAIMTKQTGIQLSLSEHDMKQYLSTVLKEIKVLQNVDEILKKGKYILESSIEFLACSKFGGMRLVYNNYFDTYEKVIMNKYRKGEHKGIRWVTSITDKDSANLVRLFLNIGVQIRHVKNMPPIDFAVSDKEMMATIEKMEGGEMAQSLLVSNEPAYINHFASIFEEMWKNGIDANERIKDIETGVDLAGIEVIPSSARAQDVYLDIIKSASEEILWIFPTTNAFLRQDKMGAIPLAMQAARERNVKVKILVPANSIVQQKIRHIKEYCTSDMIDVRYIEQMSETKATILVADRKDSMVMELKDDSKTTFAEAIGLSTYSNSKAGVLSYVSIFENLWKQSELYEQLMKAHEQLKEAHEQLKIHDKMQKEFINIAAHELRTPIQPILSLSEVVLNNMKDIKQAKLLEVINRNGKRLQRLTEDILDVTKIESQSLNLKREYFNLNDVITNAIDDMMANKVLLKAENKNNSAIKLLYTPQKVFVNADKARISQVILNLLDNAVKFTRDSGGTITVILEKKEDESNNNGQHVIISIKDTGKGIDPDIFPRLFTKFATKSEKGTGLGLFICKGIIEAHGGKIWAQNNSDGKGATFSFSLPIVNK
jgi:signal transduction histidine kinase